MVGVFRARSTEEQHAGADRAGSREFVQGQAAVAAQGLDARPEFP